ncbi:MAG TPA: murein L,D-transpeptidase catalytic domain family protein [Lacibacter sp.]|nr:murein L,D-transpeptidase catalytic domain family protein [Lacibacter sp.]HMO89351.1 murein L,D-transpeptidase catalytic domain family protein [Lacibacter sp.]HMP88012.1 murein L,D-transpeptidase catalytic domain family protein [Lacibacter sp.]
MKPGYSLLLAGILLLGSFLYLDFSQRNTTPCGSPAIIPVEEIAAAPALAAKAKEAAAFIREKGMELRFCFLVDMQVRSGKKRFFVYDLQHNRVAAAGTVTHGRCNERWLEGRRYDNTPGCGCTSLGRYRIGARYNGRFGMAYKLHGLDSSNSNAFRRYVVLHAHACVPAEEVFTEICQSDGCPTVAPAFLQELKRYLDQATAPVLLWMYHS